MNNFVKLLRSYAAPNGLSTKPAMRTALREAADEIERLETALDELSKQAAERALSEPTE